MAEGNGDTNKKDIVTVTRVSSEEDPKVVYEAEVISTDSVFTIDCVINEFSKFVENPKGYADGEIENRNGTLHSKLFLAINSASGSKSQWKLVIELDGKKKNDMELSVALKFMENPFSKRNCTNPILVRYEIRLVGRNEFLYKPEPEPGWPNDSDKESVYEFHSGTAKDVTGYYDHVENLLGENGKEHGLLENDKLRIRCRLEFVQVNKIQDEESLILKK